MKNTLMRNNTVKAHLRAKMPAYLIKKSLTLFAIGLAITSCNKKSDDNGAGMPSNAKSSAIAQLSPMRSHKFLSNLPAKTIGFSLLDYTLPSSARWLSSAWGKSQSSFSDLAKKLDDKDADVKKMITLLEGLEEGGLLPSSKAAGNVEQVLAYITSEQSAVQKSLPVFVVVENLKSGLDAALLLTTAKAKIESAGIAMKEAKIEGGSSYSTELVLFQPKEKTDQVLTTTITFTAKSNRFVISSSPSQPVVALLNDEASTGIMELKTEPAYVKALSLVADSADEFSLSYIDTKKLLLALNDFVPNDKVSSDDLKKVPVQSVAYARSMGEAMVDSAAVTLAQSLDTNNQAIEDELSKELSAVNASSFFTQVPKGLVGLLTVDGALIKAIAQSAIQATPEKERAEAQAAISPVLGAKELGVAIRPQKGASPLPELAILIETTDAPTLTQTITAMIASGTGSQGFLPPFQKKDINGVPVQFALSPFGAGVFIGNTDTHVLLASAENLMTELIEIQKGGASGALEDLTKESKQILSNPQALAAFHVDYASVAQLVESLSSSLGIFTGGQPLMEAKDLEALRNLGKTAIQLVFKDNSLQIVSRSETGKS